MWEPGSGAEQVGGRGADHARVAQADPALGYKDDTEVEAWLRDAGATDVQRVEMPANNLAFIAGA